MTMSEKALRRMKVREEIAGMLTNPGRVPGGTEENVRRAIKRAIKVGGTAPFEFMGMGATGVVLCDENHAYKVALSPTAHTFLAEEVMWLAAANSILEVRPFVAELIGYDQKLGVMIRECVRGKPGGILGGGGSAARVRAIYDHVEPFMRRAGWSMPEEKQDSVVFDSRGRGKIIDASHGTVRL